MESLTVQQDILSESEENREIDDDLRRTSLIFLSTFLVGWLAIVFRFVGQVWNDQAHKMDANWHSETGTVFSHMCTDLIWTLAFFAGGFLGGFLFGIPKTITSDSSSLSIDTTKKVPARLKVNTNLEDISDWLTKILVGATLTQITRLPHVVGTISGWIASGDAGAQAAPFMAAIIISYSALGFLSGYIGTRMFFTRAFSRQA